MKKEPFAFHKEKWNAISWISKTVDNCIKFHIIYAEKSSQFVIVDCTKKHNSMQQANHKNYSSVGFKSKKILERFLALRNVKMQKTRKIAFQGWFWRNKKHTMVLFI